VIGYCNGFLHFLHHSEEDSNGTLSAHDLAGRASSTPIRVCTIYYATSLASRPSLSGLEIRLQECVPILLIVHYYLELTGFEKRDHFVHFGMHMLQRCIFPL